MGKNDLKADMMELLRMDEDLRSVIRDVCSREDDAKEKSSLFDKVRLDGKSVAKDGPKSLFGKSEKDYAAESKKLLEMVAVGEQKIDAQAEMIDNLKQDVMKVGRLLSDAQRENDRLNKELSSKTQACRALTARMQELESAMNGFRESTDQVKQEATRLKHENAEQSRMLSRRFSKGWELFCAYRDVSVQSKRLLGSVFVKSDDFTSFICGSAQDRSLEKIWDVIKGCVVQGNMNDADILWEIFEYAVELVNSAKTERIYEIMDVNPGVPFDIDLHALAAGSRAQGNIQDVFLLGYKNVYANRVERKSIVRV